ncbi:hypothetical protein EZS27_025955 [termite gut metagenome]|uniref:Uncharacterized protein n=1 Tax=termite gut metagenome TaxID=433724 RepID=A0A5J4QVE5_9ZZZZ
MQKTKDKNAFFHNKVLYLPNITNNSKYTKLY